MSKNLVGKPNRMTSRNLSVAMQANIPTIIWGPPGVGKTSKVYDVSEMLGLECEVVTASIREPSDLLGMPIAEDSGEQYNLAPPNWAKKMKRIGESGEGGVIFFDEVNTAPPAVQSALMRVILERVVGDLHLPENIIMVAAGNPPSDSPGAYYLASPLANRFCHLSYEVEDAYEWSENFVEGWESDEILELSDNWEDGIPKAKRDVSLFIQNRHKLLMQQPDDQSRASGPWASPRTWEMTSFLLAAARDAGMPMDEFKTLAVGCVGNSVGREFGKWVANRDLIDVSELLENPYSYEGDFSEMRQDLRGTICDEISTYIGVKYENNEKEEAERAYISSFKVVDRMLDDGAESTALSLAEALVSAQTNPEFLEEQDTIKEVLDRIEEETEYSLL